MSKQSMPGDKTGWKRGAGPYSKSYPSVDQFKAPGAKRDIGEQAESEGNKNDGYPAKLGRGAK